jgi:hypothetical protein
MAKKDSYATDDNQDFSLLGLHLDEVKDPEVLPDNTEAELRIEQASIAPTSKGGNMIKVFMTVVDNPVAKPVFLNLVIPDETHEEKAKYFMKLQLKHFFEAIGVDAGNPGSPQDWIGSTAWAILKSEMGKDNSGADTELQHKVVRWVKAQ